jgi:lysophospholipase L1-like esterase
MKLSTFKYPAIILALGLMSFVCLSPPVIKVYLIGDSTMSLYDNRAKPGRSTRTFLAENRWKPIADSLHEGDYVMIQFGHNDEGDSIKYKDRFTPVPDFKKNMIKFITEAQAKKANPILVTPVSRRQFDKSGNMKETHVEYSKAVFEVGEQYHVPVIDLDKKSRELYQQMGEAKAKILFMELDSAEHPNYPLGRHDGTHFNEYGARKIAQLVLNELKVQQIPLADHIVKGANQPTVAPAAK